MMKRILLHRIAYARSGDKGNSANIGVLAYTSPGYQFLLRELTTERVLGFIRPLGVSEVIRYELPNLEALNFVCLQALAGGGSLSLRTDAQGKALGQALLQMEIEMSEELLTQCIRGCI